jgi:hypothetical protein
VNIPPATIQTAPQASSAQSIGSGKDGAENGAIGFAQALFAAGLSDAATSVPTPITANSSLSTGSKGPAKNTKQPASKEPPKDGTKKNLTVPVTTALQATLSPPLRLLPFSRETENHEASTSAAKDTAAPAEASTANPTADARSRAEKTPAAPGGGANADSAREVSKAPAQENQSAAPSGDLTFAAKVQPAAAPSADPAVSPKTVQHELTVAEQAKKAADKDAADPAVVQPIAAGADASLSAQGQHGQLGQYTAPEAASAPPAAASQPAAPAAPMKAAEPTVPEAQPKATTPLKDISLQVAQQGNQKVEVRMVQQSGELRVAVRTGDSDLAHGLQQGLSDLVGRLQENGFRAEAWRPGGAAVQAGPVPEARTSSSNPQNGDSQSNSSGSHQQQGERRQNQSQRPAWVEELENTIAGGAKSQGVSYGIGS